MSFNHYLSSDFCRIPRNMNLESTSLRYPFPIFNILFPRATLLPMIHRTWSMFTRYERWIRINACDGSTACIHFNGYDKVIFLWLTVCMWQ